jgi:Asp-tRNA(Asn)/Glu-tRNA(Gln) amidotransferase A subunit family amidase
MARTVGDTVLLLQAIAPEGSPEFPAGAKTSSLRIGVPRQHFYEALHPEVETAVEEALLVLQRIARTLETADLENGLSAINDLSNLLTKTEAYGYHREHVAATPELYQPETLRRIRAGAGVSEQTYGRALEELQQTRRSAVRIFETVDVLVTPTVPVPPFKIADLLSDPETLRNKEQLTLRNTRPFNVLGWPTISVPCGQTRAGLPIGLQISGPPGGESTVLGLAGAYEREFLISKNAALDPSHA